MAEDACLGIVWQHTFAKEGVAGSAVQSILMILLEGQIMEHRCLPSIVSVFASD